MTQENTSTGLGHSHPDLIKYPAPLQPDLLVMVDIESLALGPRPVVTQVCMLGYDIGEGAFLERQHNEFYPIDPQLEISPPRKITGSTIAWWMKQADEARARFDFSVGTDFQDLVALCRGIIQTFNALTQDGKANYVICSKGPQFDIVALETLLAEVGLEVPWAHDRVDDLRTLLRRAAINPKWVTTPSGFIPHVAYWDAKWQVAQYLETLKG